MKTLTAPLSELPAFQNILRTLREPSSCVLVSGCTEHQILHLTHSVCEEQDPPQRPRVRLLVTYSDKRARELREQNLFYDRNTVIFPAKDLIFYQADLRGKELTKERIRTLRSILEGRPVTVVTTFAALMTPQVPLQNLQAAMAVIQKGEELSLPDISRRLTELGYEKNYQVEKPGQFAVRGDILDIYDLTEENPVRIELWGDEVESVRRFDVLSQRSIEQLEAVRIFPATEMILPARRLHDGLSRIRKEADRTIRTLRDKGESEAAARLKSQTDTMLEAANEWQEYDSLESCIHYFYPATETFLDFFDPEKTLLVWDEPHRIKEHADAVETEFRESMASRLQKGYILPGQMQLLSGTEEILAGTERFKRLAGSALGQGAEFLRPQESAEIRVRGSVPFGGSFETLEKELRRYHKEGFRIVIVSPSRTRARRLAQELTRDEITAFYSENPGRKLRAGEVMTFYGHLRQGFEYPDLRFALITETDIFGASTTRHRKKKKYSGEQIRAFSELKTGDYVVHENYGIGIYRGVEKLEVGKISKDYLKIEYGGGGALYVLPTDLSVLQKYSASTASKPKLNKLGSSDWSTTKSRVRKAVEEVADDLVSLYAARREKKGHIFGPDTVWQNEFEEMFPFDETDDQLSAIEDF